MADDGSSESVSFEEPVQKKQKRESEGKKVENEKEGLEKNIDKLKHIKKKKEELKTELETEKEELNKEKEELKKENEELKSEIEELQMNQKELERIENGGTAVSEIKHEIARKEDLITKKEDVIAKYVYLITHLGQKLAKKDNQVIQNQITQLMRILTSGTIEKEEPIKKDPYKIKFAPGIQLAKCSSGSNKSNMWPVTYIGNIEICLRSRIDDDDENRLPIALMDEAFAKFEQIVHEKPQQMIQHSDVEFVETLCRDMSLCYETEIERQEQVLQLLRQYLEVPIIYNINSCLKLFMSNCKCRATIYLPLEGSTSCDPFMHDMYLYRFSTGSTLDVCTESGSNIPAIPYIIISGNGPNLSVTGCIDAKSFCLFQPLTYPLLWKNSISYLKDLIFCLVALKSTIRSLVTRTTASALVEPSDFPYFNQYEKDNVSYKLTYASRLKRFVFTAALSASGQQEIQVVVKFSTEYGLEAHQWCSEKGVSPHIHYHGSLNGIWFITVMDYWSPLDGLGAAHIDSLRKWVQDYHCAQFVHGDLRSVNVFNRNGHLAILDFDWAGKEGSTTYPLRMNKKIKWPPGAEPGKLITKEHDLFWIEHCVQKLPK